MVKYDVGAGLSSGLSGAATGAAIGGPPGALAGGLIGLTGGLFGSGKKKKKKVSTFDKRQKQLNEEQYQGLIGEGPLADLYKYNPEQANDVFNKNVANPAYQKFQENIIPSITGQFRKQGLQNSSFVGDALSRAGRDVQQGLDAQRAQYLYGQQQGSQASRQNAVENLQNRQTFAYDKAAPQSGGFDINSLLSSINPEMIGQLKNYFGV